MGVDEAWQDRRALDVNDFRINRYVHLGVRPHGYDASLLDHHHGIGERVSAGAVNQGPIDLDCWVGVAVGAAVDTSIGCVVGASGG
jgi:hypothetical protein